MLKQLRQKKTAKRILYVLAGVIIIAFVFLDPGGLRPDKTAPSFSLKIYGKKISYEQFRDAAIAVRNAAIMQFGDNFSQVQKYLDLESQAVDRLILLQEAKRRKVRVSDNEVIESVGNLPFFQRNGKFDNQLYEETLQYTFRTQPRLFEEETRQNIMLGKLYKEITESITANEDEIKEEYRKANQEFSIYYIVALASDFTAGLEPSEEKLKEYFAGNSLQFKLPASFNMDYAAIESEEQIRELTRSLNRKERLDKIIKDLKLDFKETGLFAQSGPIPGIGWSPEILKLISKLKIGEFSPPIQADKKYYILRLKEKKDAYIPDFDIIQQRVKDTFIQEESKRIAKENIDQAMDRTNELYQQDPGSADFEQAAKELNLKSGSTIMFKFGSYIEGIGASDDFWLEADKLKDGQPSGIISLPSGFYIIKLKSKAQLDQEKFKGEKEEFSLKILSQKKQEFFSRFAEDLKRKALSPR